MRVTVAVLLAPALREVLSDGVDRGEKLTLTLGEADEDADTEPNGLALGVTNTVAVAVTV